MTWNKTVVAAVLLFSCVWLALLPSRLSVPPSVTFAKDPSDYSSAAIHLIEEHLYSLDGVHPTDEREPGYSVFLAVIYSVFGIENRLAIFLMQGAVFLTAALLFAGELKRHTSSSLSINVHHERIASWTLFFLLLCPSVYHTVFSAYRENFALSLTLFFAASFLRFQREPSWMYASVSGALLGALILTYIPFLFFPIVLLPLPWILGFPKRYTAALIMIPLFIVSLWAGRNALQGKGFRIAAPERTAIMLYVRGEQAEHIRGFEPFRCLWAEYIARNWEGRSPQCSFNGVMHGLSDSGGLAKGPAVIASEGKAKIFAYFPHYLWFSVFEILELHVPYVNGWGFAYNALDSLAIALLYLGCLFAIPFFRRKEYVIVLLLIFYCTVIYSLTDATPRYHMPIIFCYCVLAAAGYDALFKRLRKLW